MNKNSSIECMKTGDCSVAKTLTMLRSQPSNRSCCDCRCALIDPSIVFASVCRPENSIDRTIYEETKSRKMKNIDITLQDFHLTHRSFAPSNEGESQKKANDDGKNQCNFNVDPAISANERFGGHCVFICSRCAEAHRQLGPKIKVIRVVDSALWTPVEAQFIATCEGNAICWRIYEAFMPDSFLRPIFSSPLSTRILFCRAKYEALAFCLPPPGPLAGMSWRIILRNYQKKNKQKLGKKSFTISANLKDIYSLSLLLTASNISRHTTTELKGNKPGREYGLPNRLIDYFCVISSSSQLLPNKTTKDKKTESGRLFQFDITRGVKILAACHRLLPTQKYARKNGI